MTHSSYSQFRLPVPISRKPHYTGMCQDIDARLARHKAGNGSRLMSVVAERQVSWELCQLVRCESYQEAHELEKRLKKHGAARRCPICQGKPFDDLVFRRQHGFYRFSHTSRRRCPMPQVQHCQFVRRRVE